MAARPLAALIRRPRPSSRTPPRQARLYLKADCGLCEAALELLRPLVRAGRLAVETVDIEADPQLFRRYCLRIPVLELRGGPTLDWPFDHLAVRRALG